jgi:hypothetical protein
MNNKAQGLPINFIVLAALAILIMVLGAGFVIAGGSSVAGSIGPQVARNTCQGYCSQAQSLASQDLTSPDNATLWAINTKFCTIEQTVQGYNAPQGCTAIGVNCILTFGDGSSQQIKC